MVNPLVEMIVGTIQRTYSLLLKVTDEMSTAQLTRVVEATSPPIAWHFWHCARWADRLQSAMRTLSDQAKPDIKSETWRRNSVAEEWGFDAESLGFSESGTRINGQIARELTWPDRSRLHEYGRNALSAADQALAELTAHGIDASCESIFTRDEDATVGTDLIRYLTHLSRHLGMIEAVRGTIGMQGSATV